MSWSDGDEWPSDPFGEGGRGEGAREREGGEEARRPRVSIPRWLHRAGDAGAWRDA